MGNSGKMKEFRLVDERRKTVIHLDTYQSRYDGLEDVVRACVTYLLDKGQVDRVQDMLMSLAIQAHRSPAEKSKHKPKERREIRELTEAFLRNEGPPE